MYPSRPDIFKPGIWFGLALVIAVLARLASAYSLSGYYHPDEYNSYVEPAYNWAFPDNPHPTDTSYVEGYRSFYIQSWHYLMIKLFQSFDAYNPTWVAMSLRLIMALASLWMLFWVYRITTIYLPRLAVWTTTCCALWYYFIYFSPRVLSENYSMLFLLPAFYHMARYERRGPADKGIGQMIMAGVLISFATQLRLQSAFLCLPLAGYLLWNRSYRPLLALILSFWLPFITFGVLEIWLKGGAFTTLQAYLDICFLKEADMMQNTDVWYGYLRSLNIQMTEWLFPLVVLSSLVAGRRRSPLLAISAWGFIAIHSFFPHKEVRFIFAMQPILVVLAILGCYEIFHYLKKNSRLQSLAFATVAWLAFISAQGVKMMGTDFTGGLSGQAFRIMQELRQEDDMVRLIQVRKGLFLGHFSLHKPVPIEIVDHPDLLPRKAGEPRKGDYVLYDRKDEVALEKWLDTYRVNYKSVRQGERMRALKIVGRLGT